MRPRWSSFICMFLYSICLIYRMGLVGLTDSGYTNFVDLSAYLFDFSIEYTLFLFLSFFSWSLRKLWLKSELVWILLSVRYTFLIWYEVFLFWKSNNLSSDKSIPLVFIRLEGAAAVIYGTYLHLYKFELSSFSV